MSAPYPGKPPDSPLFDSGCAPQPTEQARATQIRALDAELDVAFLLAEMAATSDSIERANQAYCLALEEYGRALRLYGQVGGYSHEEQRAIEAKLEDLRRQLTALHAPPKRP